MKDFTGKVGVITGAASGIGRAMAERFARAGMKVVLADIEEPALAQTAESIKATGGTVLAVPTDVSRASDVETLAQKACETFGAVHILCNNAGVVVHGALWENTAADWTWVAGVNLGGVVHGIRVFVPIMLAQNSPCHIVNTASVVALTSGPQLGIYAATKHGVVALSETLHHDLTERGADIKVSVLCPGLVDTRIFEADRNRPAALRNTAADETLSPKYEALIRSGNSRLTVMAPQQIAEAVFQAVREEKFYILTHPGTKFLVRARFRDILRGRDPTGPLARSLRDRLRLWGSYLCRAARRIDRRR